MKSKRILSASRIKLIILAILIAITAVLLVTQVFNKNKSSQDSETINKDNEKSPQFNNPEVQLDSAIDSILFTFGIKKEWITTEKSQRKKAEWFTKSVLIPKDLTSVEVNLDINYILTGAGLSSKVNEDIITKDVLIHVNNPDTSKTLPAAIIQITHSDKVRREAGVIALILDKVNEFSIDGIDKLIITKNEFSYIFPRNLDDIEIQHKLLKHKKDVIINLTMGGSENYEADFNSAMDDKAINERVRSFNADFGSINKVLITKNAEGDFKILQRKITSALNKYNITIINDSMLTQAFNNSEKDKLGSFFSAIIQKASLSKFVIAVIPADKSGFDDFYNRVMILKKLGHRFVNLTEYFNYTKEEQKRENELKQEQVKKKTQEEVKKKKDVKVPPQKDVKKKTEKKKK